MTMHEFNLNAVDASWRPIIKHALTLIDTTYLNQLYQSSAWLPGPQQIFNAFTLPISEVNYVLFGESPYPRAESANGYAFWDANVKALWTNKGLSKEVNRATSLRNMVKMLLVAEGLLPATQTTQDAIAQLDKSQLVQTNAEFFGQFLQHGFLLLNTTSVLQIGQAPKYDARAWQPFVQFVLEQLIEQRPNVQLLFFGAIAQNLSFSCLKSHKNQLHAEHPYNISFIQNPQILGFFRPLHLLYPIKKDKVIDLAIGNSYAHTVS